PLETNGVVGFVRDVAGDLVVNATVYFVPATDIPSDAIDLSTIENARQSTVDEPLEDTIASKGGNYTKAITDANGIYRVATLPGGAYFITVVPATADKGHLPGGSLCRKVKNSADLIGKQMDIAISATHSEKAEYVGPSACLNCHSGTDHEKKTLHMLGIRVIGKTGPFQDSSRFPTWNDPLAKFTTSGTTLYYFGYNGNTTSPDWKASETNPGAGVSFTAKLYKDGAGKFFVDLTNVAGTAATQTYEVELSYGGGLYKQRYVTKIGDSRYILPIQFNFQGQTDEVSSPSSRWVWQQYNAQNWYDETNKSLKTPAKGKAFDNNCAGCHFTGIKVTGDATAGFKAHGVPD
ncbi:MAG TPA: carboxypeptidase-like regulatory domain-containing protein, partial [bacterium]|nr:carboxypeptidase-like regulatory domain-containing protein [bacterium]